MQEMLRFFVCDCIIVIKWDLIECHIRIITDHIKAPAERGEAVRALEQSTSV